MLRFLDIILLQLSDHICGNSDKKQLEIVQWQIQHRINYLEKNNLSIHNDPELFHYYETHRQIQDCIAQNPNDNIEILVIMFIVFIFITVFIIFAVKKANTIENT